VGQAPSQADHAAAAAALSVASNPIPGETSETTPSVASSTTGQGTSTSYNPMAWLSAAPAPTAGEGPVNSGAAVKGDVAV
jgi:hypothetical protein